MNQLLFFRNTYISKQEREKLNGHKAFTLWMTGLSGAGKSTLATKIDKWLYKQSLRSYVLDGDNVRLGINNDLGFSQDDRKENARRIAEICKLFNDAGVIVITAFIAPFNEDRLLASEIIGKPNFNEIFIDADLHTCIERDTKGLYKLALDGKISEFTGINSPYDRPKEPALHVKTDTETIENCTEHIIDWLKDNKINIED